MKKQISKKIIALLGSALLISQTVLAEPTLQASAPKVKSSSIESIKLRANEYITKLKSYFKDMNILSKTEKFVEGKSKQNNDALEAAADGQMKVVGKRYIAKDPAAKKVQEKLDKAQSERLKKYDSFDGP